MTARLVMRAATPAARDIKASGLQFEPENTAHIFIGALLGASVSGYEEALALGIPINFDERKGTHARALRRDVAMDVIRKLIANQHEKRSELVPSDEDLELMATKAWSYVNDYIEKLGLFVYTQRLLFSPRYADIAMRVLAEMKDPASGLPVTASGAIAQGLIPALPTHDLKGHLKLLGPQKAPRLARGGEPFSTWVAKYRPVVIEFPPPDFRTAATARADMHSRSTTMMSSSLGMGFVLIAKDDSPSLPDNHVIVTPILVHRQPIGAASGVWHAEIENVQTVRAAHGAEYQKLKSILSEKKYQPAKLDVCASCAEIYSNDRADLRCACAK